MAGLFDFKSAEEILKERQDATRKNVMEAFNQPGQYKVRGERTANAVGKALGLLGGRLFAGSPEEQVAGQMQRANQLAQSLKPIEGESQSQFYNRVAVSFNDAGYSQNALKALTLAKEAEAADAKETQRQLERGELTKYQQELVEQSKNRLKLEEDKLRYERNLYGGGTGAGGGTSSNTGKSYKPGDRITDSKTGNVLVVQPDGTLEPEEKVIAAQNLSNRGIGTEPSAGEGFLETLANPWRALNNWSQGVENESSLQFVQNALKRNSFRPEDERAAMRVLEMPRELTGLTEAQYKILEEVVTGGLKLGGQ